MIDKYKSPKRIGHLFGRGRKRKPRATTNRFLSQTKFFKNAFKLTNRSRVCKRLTLIIKTSKPRFWREIFTCGVFKRSKI